MAALFGIVAPLRIATLAGSGLTERGGALYTVDATGAQRNLLDDGSGGMDANGDVFADGFHANTSYAGGIETSSGTYGGDWRFQLLLVDASAAAAAVAIPNAIGFPTGWTLNIKKTDSSANNVTVSQVGGTIDGAASVALTAQWEAVTIQFDGTNWWIVAQVAATIL